MNNITLLRNYLIKTDYVMLINLIMTSTDRKLPENLFWYDYESVTKKIDDLCLSEEQILIIKFFYLGENVSLNKLKYYLGKKLYLYLLDNEIIVETNDTVKTNNLVVMPYNGLLLLTELRYNHNNCINKFTNVYADFDSVIMENLISIKPNKKVLDLCSGTGIQGLSTSYISDSVTAVEKNEYAKKIATLNIELNNVTNMTVKNGNLFEPVKNHRFDYILMNPPFMPIPDILKNPFPIAGDGGILGDEVLIPFFENLQEYLVNEGESFVFCQALGNYKDILINEKISKLENDLYVDCYILNKIPITYYIDQIISMYEHIHNISITDEEKISMYEYYPARGFSYIYTIFYCIRRKYKKLRVIDISNDYSYEDVVNLKNNITVNNEDGQKLLISEYITAEINEISADILNILISEKTISIGSICDSIEKKYSQKLSINKHRTECLQIFTDIIEFLVLLELHDIVEIKKNKLTKEIL